MTPAGLAWRAGLLGLLAAWGLALGRPYVLALALLAGGALLCWTPLARAAALRAWLRGWAQAPWRRCDTRWALVLLLVAHLALLISHAPLQELIAPGFGCGYCAGDVPWAARSDANMWLEIGTGLADEGRFPKRRPLFGFLVAGLAWVTPRPWLAPTVSVVNVLLEVVAVGLLVGLVGRRYGRSAGVLTAGLCWLYLGPNAVHAVSEPLGLLLLVLALLLWERLSPGSWERRLGLGGLAFGLANVARPFTLPAAPLLFGAVLLTAPKGRRVSGAAALTLGVSLAVVPVLLVNRAVFGVASVSLNSADALWAATHPDFGSWSPAADVAMTRPGESYAERYQRLSAEAKANLAEHPGLYLRRTASRLQLLVRPYFRLEWLLLGSLFPLVALSRAAVRRRWLLGLLALGLAGGGVLVGSAVASLGLAALFLARADRLRRPPQALDLALFAGALLGGAALGFVEARAALSVEWVRLGLLAGALVALRDVVPRRGDQQ